MGVDAVVDSYWSEHDEFLLAMKDRSLLTSAARNCHGCRLSSWRIEQRHRDPFDHHRDGLESDLLRDQPARQGLNRVMVRTMPEIQNFLSMDFSSVA
jgi:hypothetical protein